MCSVFKGAQLTCYHSITFCLYKEMGVYYQWHLHGVESGEKPLRKRILRTNDKLVPGI